MCWLANCGFQLWLLQLLMWFYKSYHDLVKFLCLKETQYSIAITHFHYLIFFWNNFWLFFFTILPKNSESSAKKPHERYNIWNHRVIKKIHVGISLCIIVQLMFYRHCQVVTIMEYSWMLCFPFSQWWQHLLYWENC